MALRHPSDKRVVDIYGDHLIAGGDLDGALTHFKNHLADEPPQMDYYMAVIDIEDYKSRPDSVDLYVQRAVQLFPNDPVLYIRKANRQYVKGDLHSSVETFTEALAIAPTDSLKGQIWGYIGDTYHAMYERLEAGAEADTTGFKLRINQKKALKQCFESYEKALALYGDNVMTLNNYAYFLSESTDDMAILEEAMKMSARAIYLEKGNATYLDTFAWILYKLGRSEQARTHMRQALSLDTTESPELPLHYGDILFSLNERFMADTYWKKALDMGADKQAVEQRLAIPKDAKDKRVEDFLVVEKKKRR
jgi:tetratricopeptide (TPR) repeat protein